MIVVVVMFFIELKTKFVYYSYSVDLCVCVYVLFALYLIYLNGLDNNISLIMLVAVMLDAEEAAFKVLPVD